MKIFTVGHFKTGTTSYSAAAKQLGIMDIHFPGDYANKLTETGQVYVYTQRPWDSMSNLHELEYKQCDLIYPNSKFVLTTRDVDKWLRSIQKFMQPSLSQVVNRRFEKVFGVPRKPEAFDDAYFRKKFLDHEAEVKDFFSSYPPGKFVVLDLDKDPNLMKTLKDFLEDFPRPYPRLNITQY